MKKRVLSFVLAIAMLASLGCVTASAADGPSVQLSTISFTASTNSEEITEGAAKTEFALNDVFALKIAFENGSNDTTFVKNFGISIEFDPSYIDTYTFKYADNKGKQKDSDYVISADSGLQISGSVTDAPEGEKKIATIAGMSLNGVEFESGDNYALAYFLFKVRADAEKGSMTFKVINDKGNELGGTASSDDQNSTSYGVNFVDITPANISIPNGNPPTIGSVTLSESAVTVDGKEQKTLNATAKSSRKSDITKNVTWSISPSDEKVKIDENTGVITVAANAGTTGTDTTYTVTAAARSGSSKGDPKTATFTVTRAAAEAKEIKVYKDYKDGDNALGTTDTVIIPTGDTANVYTYSAKVFDQYGDVMESASATLTMTGKLADKYSDGKITLSNSDTGYKDETGTLTASYTGVTDVTVTITAKDIEIKAPKVTIKDEPTYGDTWAQIVTIGTGTDGGSASLNGVNVPGTFELSEPNAKPEAGENKTFEIYFKSTDGQYNVLAYSGKVNVAKATPTLSLAAKDATYTGAAYAETNVTATCSLADAPVTYTYYADNSNAKGDALSGAPIAAGTYWVVGTVAESDNYNSVTAEKKFTVNKAKLTATAEDNTITYGEAPANNGVTYSGFVTGETESVVTTAPTYDYTYTQYGDIGDYEIKPAGAVAANYDITYKNGKLTVNPKEVTLTWSTEESGTTFYYDGETKTVTATAGGLVSEDKVDVIVLRGEQTEAGTYTATASALAGAKAGNYKLPDENTKEYTIAYAIEKVTVTPDTVTATIDQSKKEITLVGYAKESDKIEPSATDATLKTENGKTTLTAHDVTYTVIDKVTRVPADAAGLIANKNVNKPEDADESIDDALVSGIGTGTTCTGLAAAVADAVFKAAAKDVTEIDVTLVIQPKKYETGKSLKLEIHPEVIYKKGTEETTPKKLDNSAIKAPITITITLPLAMAYAVNAEGTNVVVRHEKEYIKVKYNSTDRTITWEQSSFSEVDVEIINGEREVTFEFNTDGSETKQYTASDIGTDLPTDTKAGSTFNGWKFYKVEGEGEGRTETAIDNGTYKTLTEDLLKTLSGAKGDGVTIKAKPEFTTKSSSGGISMGSGSSTSVSVATPTGGRVSVSTSSAKKGDTVTITASPNMGKQVDTVTVTDANGSKVKVTDIGKNKYTFVMPATKVTVKVTFVDSENGDTPEPTIDFVDVAEGSYYYDAVAWAVANGITTGNGVNTFGPNYSCTRAQMVTFLWRLAGSPTAYGSNPFADVAEGSYYYDAVIWAVANGITNGTGVDTFSPDATVTRGQSVTFLYRYAGQPTGAAASGFIDVAADAYYADAVAWAAENGVTTGNGINTFGPNDACTRAQIVTFMYRYAG